MDKNILQQIVAETAKQFPSFGGDKSSEFNPIAKALKGKPAMFAAGVDIEEVVKFVISSYYNTRYVTE